MKSAFAAVAAALCFAASALAQDPPLVNTPLNAPVCQPLLITWGGGTPPYFLHFLATNDIISSIVPGGQPGAAALLDFGQQTGTSLTWRVNITVGTALGLTLRDSTGAVSQSGQFTVQESSDTSCLNGGSSSSSSSSATGSSTSSSGSSSAVSTSSAVSSSSSATSTATTPTSSHTSSATSVSSSHSSSSASSSAASQTPSSAASTQNVKFGLAGALGAAIIAVMA